MGTTRRTFLQVTVFGAAVLALGSVGLGLRGTVYRAPSQPLLALSPAGFSVLAAVAETPPLGRMAAAVMEREWPPPPPTR